MTPLVKICGLTRAQDVRCAVDIGAAFVGFIVEAASKRRLSVESASALSAPARGHAKIVAVTVNADDATLSDIMVKMAPDYIQCHGDESPSRVAQIAARHHVGVIKALPISTDSDMKSSEEFVGAADFILFDAKPPAGSDVRGGHGITVDWAVIARAPLPKTFALAGGLTPANAARAATQTRAPILDVSSGVEAAPGVKDPQKIKAFMEAIEHV